MAQTIYYNGTILTMVDAMPQVEAVLTENGRILEAGAWHKVKGKAGKGARMADLKGQVMMPGLIDPHSHFTACASQTMEADLEGASSFEDIITDIRRYISEKGVGEGEWVVAAGYDHNRLKEGVHPNRGVLDMAAPGNPLILKHQSGHMGVFNTRALERLGVAADTQAPEGGAIEVKDGCPTGYMEENAFVDFQRRIPMPAVEAFLDAYARAQRMYASYGITTVQEGMMTEQLVPLYEALLKSGLLKLDLVAYMDIARSARIKEAFENHIKRYQGHIRIGGYKIFLDGSPQGRTAWMRAPYVAAAGSGEPEGYRGYNALEDGQVRDDILRAERDGLQLLAHCNGDMAAGQYLEQLEAAYRELEKGGPSGFRRGDIRPVMVHAQFLGLDQMRRVKALGVIPSFFLAHIYHWGDTHIRNFGIERARCISPAASALKEGIRFTLHQDSPVIRPDMMETVWCAVNRRTRDGIVLGEQERIPVWDALKAITVNGARQYFEENEKGAIERGKKADFVVLDRNPLESEAERLRDIRVLATIKEDRALWEA